LLHYFMIALGNLRNGALARTRPVENGHIRYSDTRRTRLGILLKIHGTTASNAVPHHPPGPRLLLTVFSPHLLRLFLFLTAHLNIPRLVFLLLAEKPLLLVGWNHLVRRQWLLPLLMFLLLMLLLLPMLHTSRLGLYGRLSLAGVRVHPREEGMRVRSDPSDTLHHRVEGRARPALNPEEVPGPVLVRPLAVVAHNGDGLRKVGGDRLQLDAHGHRVPGWLHPLVRLGRLLAHGTARVVRGQLPEAVPVDGMAAGHLVRRRAGAEEVLLADGAVLHVLAYLAVVLREEGGVDAHSAVLTVAEVFRASDAAEAAIGAVVRALGAVHPQVTDRAVVLAELDAAVDAIVAAC